LATWGTALLAEPTIRHWPALGISPGLILVNLLAGWVPFRRQEL
jgi:hypothetical protein